MLESIENTTDPVCGRSVEVEGAVHTLVYDGLFYAFCCSGCRDRFAANPRRYAVRLAPDADARS
jgi:YHS domain-containing protein